LQHSIDRSGLVELPAIIPSYMYMLAAMTVVGTLLILSFNSYAATLRSIPESQELANIVDRVAAKAVELLTLTDANAETYVYLDLPRTVGNRQYWIRLRNDTRQSWVEGGFGEYSNSEAFYEAFLPRAPSVTGHYISGYEPALLKCYMNSSVMQLVLSTGG
jgi:hypothetical protein